MLSKLALPLALLASLFSSATALPSKSLRYSLQRRVANDATPRNVIYVQTFTNPDGSQLSLLPLIQDNTQVTHVILAALHLNGGSPNDPHLNDNNPNSNYYDFLWPEVAQLQSAGVQVMMMMGGAAQGSYQLLAEDFNTYYPPLLQVLQNHTINGLDLDVEEDVAISVLVQLLQQLNSDLGEDFILTSAPVASALTAGGGNLNNVSYSDLDSQATDSNRPNGKLINWYNAQCYNGWGDAGSADTYTSIISNGWDASRIVMGVPDSGNDGSGWVSLSTLGGVISTLKGDYSNFGGVFGWEYFDAGSNDGLSSAWQWVQQIGSDLFGTNAPEKAPHHKKALRKAAKPITPFEAQMAELTAHGVSFNDALVALNRTAGNVKHAKVRLGL